MIKVSILLEGTTKADFMRLQAAFDSRILTPPEDTNNDLLAAEIKQSIYEFLRRRHGNGFAITRDDVIIVAMQVLKDES